MVRRLRRRPKDGTEADVPFEQHVDNSDIPTPQREEVTMAGVPVTIVGEAFVTGLGVGGGPMPPGPGGPPPVISGGPGSLPPWVMPPIVIPPDAIAPGVPTHPIYIPVYPSHPIVIPPGSLGGGKPEHPIYLPPSIWPSPGHPAHPIVIPPDAVSPGVPSHPIIIPPPPLGIWGGGNEPFPTPPIFLPPDTPAEEREKLLIWHIGWTARTGWVVVATPGVPHPAPSVTRSATPPAPSAR
jgi:hypothetical protein